MNLSIYLSINLSIYQSIYLSIYLSYFPQFVYESKLFNQNILYYYVLLITKLYSIETM